MAGSNKSTDLMKNANDVTQRASAQHNGRPTARVIVEYVQTLGRQVGSRQVRCRQIQTGGALLTQPPTTSFFSSPTFFTCCWFSLDTLICLVGLVCEEVLPSGRRGNPHTHTLPVPSCLARSPNHNSYVQIYFFFTLFLFYLVFFFFFGYFFCYLTFFFLCQATSALVGRPPTGGGSIYFLSHSLFLFFFSSFIFFLMFILLYASSLENKREKKYYFI